MVEARDDDLALAIEKFDHNQYADALILLKNYYNSYYPHPSCSKALLYIGKARIKSGSTIKGLQTLRFLHGKYPLSPDAQEGRLLLGRYYLKLRDYTSSIRWFEKYLEYSPRYSRKNSEVLCYIGDNFSSLEKYPEALRWYLKALKEDLNERIRKEVYLKSVGIIQERLKDEELYGFLDQDISNEMKAQVILRISESLYRRKRFDEAKKILAGVPSPISDKIVDKINTLDKLIDEQSRVIKGNIGCILPLSGNSSSFGIRVQRGLNLAFLEHSIKSKINEIRLIYRDSMSSPVIIKRITEELVFEDHVIAILGPLLSNISLSASVTAQNLGAPIMTFTQKEEITETGDYIFRVGLTNSSQIKTLVDYAINHQGLKKFAILYPDDAYGRELMNFFWDEVNQHWGEIRAVESYQPGKTDFGDEIKKIIGLYPYDETELARIKNDNTPIVDFDAIFIPDYWDTVGLLAPQLAFYDVVDITILGINGLNSNELIKRGGKYVEGAIFVDGFFINTQRPHTKQFIERYVEVFRKEPTIIDAIAYDGARILFEIMERDYIHTREGIKEALGEMVEFPGVTGNITFDKDGDAIRDLFILTIENDQITEITN